MQGKMLPEYRKGVLDYTISYAVTKDGFSVRLSYKEGENMKRTLPVTGLRFAVKQSGRKISYFGYGPQETYRDTLLSAAKDEYEYHAKDGYHRYVKPQESGNHAQTERVYLPAMKIFAAQPCDFSAILYSADELKDKAHDFELKETKKIYVFLGASEGVGSNSCGPVLAEKYHIEKEGEFAFDFKLL